MCFSVLLVEFLQHPNLDYFFFSYPLAHAAQLLSYSVWNFVKCLCVQCSVQYFTSVFTFSYNSGSYFLIVIIGLTCPLITFVINYSLILKFVHLIHIFTSKLNPEPFAGRTFH